jgi:hypothetical protein
MFTTSVKIAVKFQVRQTGRQACRSTYARIMPPAISAIEHAATPPATH